MCHRANPTQNDVFDRLLDQNYWSGSYKQRFADYADYKPYEIGGSANFWEMRRKRKAQQAMEAGAGAHFANNLRGANLYDPRNRMCVEDADLDTAHRGALRRHADRRRTSALPQSYARGLTRRLHSTESGAKGNVRMDGNWSVLQHQARQSKTPPRQSAPTEKQARKKQHQTSKKKAARPDSPTSVGTAGSHGSDGLSPTASGRTRITVPSYARPTTASSSGRQSTGRSRRSRALAPRPRMIIKSASASVLAPKANISAWASPGANKTGSKNPRGASTLKRAARAAHWTEANVAALRAAVLNGDDGVEGKEGGGDASPYSRREMLELLRKAAAAPAIPRRTLSAAARGVLA